MELTEIKPKFFYKGNEIDWVQGTSEKEMLKIAANRFSELTNGTVQYKGIVDGSKKFEFTTVTGTKG